MVTFSITCTKRSATEDEDMDVNSCINIMAQWFQAEWELANTLSKFLNTIRYEALHD